MGQPIGQFDEEKGYSVARIEVVLGSKSDKKAWEEAGLAKMFYEIGADYNASVCSAHRNPDELAQFCRERMDKTQVFICVAGMAAALPGAVAANTSMMRKIIGVPLDEHGIDSCLYMPPGVPAAPGGVGTTGLKNAALGACQVLAISDEELSDRLRMYLVRTTKPPEFDFDSLPRLLSRGKVRNTYPGDSPDTLVMVATDRISVFDVVLNEEVPGKGIVLTHVTNHWLTQTPVAEVMPNHLVTTDVDRMPKWAGKFAGRAMLVRKLDMLEVEAVVRGYITGSAWTDYQATGKVSGIELPAGLQQMQQFPEPIFTPSTKAKTGHDQAIDFEQMVEILGNRELAEQVRDLSLKLYVAGATYARKRGIILVDTKFEFGIDPETGELTLGDEVLTPDSSRYVRVEDYTIGEPPVSMDKQGVRDAMAALGWDKKAPAPPAPEGVVEETIEVYGETDRRLTDVNSIAVYP